MNPILVFAFLAVGQILVAAIGCIVAFIITMAPSIRSVRGKVIRASLLGASGGFVGVVIVYILIIAVGLAWKTIELFHLGGPAIVLADAAPWLLMSGYVAGLVGGYYIGWKFQIPFFKTS
jgi:hypothetical protein